MSMGGNTFKKTPLGEACRRAMTKIVSRLALTAGNKPWTGMVVEFDGREVYVNAGAGGASDQATVLPQKP